MNIFPNRSRLSDPITAEIIPPEDFTYVVTRSQLDMFNAVHAELVRHPLARNKLAKKMGMSESQLSRLLGAPGNWGLATAAKLFWAIAGGRMKVAVEYPLQKPKRNDTAPHWDKPPDTTTTARLLVKKPPSIPEVMR